MLHPTHNRINFGHTLRPIDGYELDYVIGTSYTLDLEAVMFLPVSLFFGEDLNIERHCSNELLSALTQVPKKVQLFCQRGKIVAPFFYHNILEFWSDNIEQVQMEDFSQSFHPKIWLIRYLPLQKNQPIKYRFICTSRNLSKSTDWDLAVAMEGTVEKTVVAANLPLLDFVQFLNANAKRKIKQELLAEIPKIHFELAAGQEAYQFYPIGNGKFHPLFSADFKAKESLIISPFLDTETVLQLAQKTGQLTLLSSKYELDKLSESIADHVRELYQFNPLLELDMSAADEHSGIKDLSDANVEAEQEYSQGNAVHAKLYVTKQGRNVAWYVGSANCTSPARSGRNIEFLTVISSSTGALSSPQELLQQLTESSKEQQGIFIPYERTEQIIDEEQEKLDRDIRRTIFDISNLSINVSVSENESKLYDYQLCIPASRVYKRSNWKIFVQPLSGIMGRMEEIIDTPHAQHFIFNDYELHWLTPYFLFTIKEEETVIKTLVLKLDIEFPEGRMKKVFSSLVGDWEKLMKYLTFLLCKEQVENLVELTENALHDKPAKPTTAWQAQYPLYEKLLVAASRDTGSLRQTIKLVEMLQDERDVYDKPLVQENFKDLIYTFKEILPDEY